MKMEKNGANRRRNGRRMSKIWSNQVSAWIWIGLIPAQTKDPSGNTVVRSDPFWIDPIQFAQFVYFDSFRHDVLIVICTFWVNRLEFFNVLELILLLITRKIHPLGLYNQKTSLKEIKIKNRGMFEN
jgi:hypothetical protein